MGTAQPALTPPSSSQSDLPEEPSRVMAFARFFKRYMSISSLVTAALPIPVTALSLIPTFHCQTKILSVYTSLFCFLILGFIFYSRHLLARLMFPEIYGPRGTTLFFKFLVICWNNVVRVLPLALIALSIFSVFKYHSLLAETLYEIGNAAPYSDGTRAYPGDADILTSFNESQIPTASSLMLYYIAIFAAAEAAFILMAIKEYLQDLLRFSEDQIIAGQLTKARNER